MRPVLSVLLLAALNSAAFAADIQVGAMMQLKPNSMSFEKADQLARWHKVKNNNTQAALAKYEDSQMHARDAWQFLEPIDVKILSYDPAKAQVEVQMKTTGRFNDVKWFVDPSALTK